MEEKRATRLNFAQRPSFAFLLGMLLGILAFLSIYGPHILNPGYEDWLLDTGGDTGQHYLGWTFFRSASWHFPPGMHNGLTYPQYTSVLYTDSFPIYALLGKLFSPLLPRVFQYFGIAGCISFMLQGGFAMVLFRQKSKSLLCCGLASLFFICSPAMVFRMFAHTSLASHWMILAALAIWQYSGAWRFRKAAILWLLLFFLLPMTHPYFVPMIFLLHCGYVVQRMVEQKQVLRYLGLLMSCVASVLLSLYLVGAFSAIVETVVVQNVDYNTANLNTFWNPLQFTQLLPARDAGLGQYEGSAYLGMGLILICLSALVMAIPQVALHGQIAANRRPVQIDAWVRICLHPFLLASVFIAAFCLALGTSVMLDGRTLFSYQPPSLILKIWSVFRATGRFVWVSWYILGYAVLSRCLRFRNQTVVTLVLIGCFVVQLYDITPYLQRDARFRNEITAETRLIDPAWVVLGKSSSHMVLFIGDQPDVNEVLDLANFAKENSLTLNDFHFARTFSLEEKLRRQAENLSHPKSDTMYVFIDQGLVWSAKQFGIRIFRINGLLIGITNSTLLPHLQEENISVLPLPLNRANTLINGMLDGVRRVLHPGGVSYGPWWTLPAGSYQIEIKGWNLADMMFLLVRNGSEFVPNTEYTVDARRDAMTVTFSLTEEQTGHYEFLLSNSSIEDAWIEDMTLRKLE